MLIQDETVRYGILLAMESKHLILRLLDGRELTCSATDAHREKLKSRIGQEIGVRGTMTYSLPDWTEQSFKIDEVLSYHAIPITAAVKASYSIFGKYMEKWQDDEEAHLRERTDHERD
ncbi:MAG: hypothetical protein AAFV98_05865 [Chloroflexota bacterium]